MAGYLKVTPEKLKSTATSFESQASSVQAVTNQMLDIVNALTGAVWTGAAQAAYSSKFRQLDNDMAMIYNKIKEHSEDLTAIAQQYEAAENKNIDASSGLNANPIV